MTDENRTTMPPMTHNAVSRRLLSSLQPIFGALLLLTGFVNTAAASPLDDQIAAFKKAATSPDEAAVTATALRRPFGQTPKCSSGPANPSSRSMCPLRLW